MSAREPASGELEAPVLELHFSPRELVRSALRLPGEEVCESGVKGRELRWQQGAIAVCILAVHTRWRATLGDAEPPVLEGERGSPARSIDNLLNKPGDWALHMFGEERGQPRIRQFIYRKRTVSRSNPVSAVQWDGDRVPPTAIRLWQAGEELLTADSQERLLRVLLEEFNPRRAEREWAAMAPAVPPLAEPAEAGASGESAPATGAGGTLPLPPSGLWLLRAGAALALLALGILIGRLASPAAEDAAALPSAASAAVVQAFLAALNASDLAAAYAHTTERYREQVSPAAFEIAYGEQRYNFPRLAGNPYRNTAASNAHEYRATLYVETEVHFIPPLENLARIPLTRIEDYAARIAQLEADLSAHGIDAGQLNQLRKERLERPDASRHLQLVAGLTDEELAAIYPEQLATTLDLTLFFELVRNPETAAWEIQAVEDASERLVAF